VPHHFTQERQICKNLRNIYTFIIPDIKNSSESFMSQIYIP
jgi:hypothetical protein